jgi:hypothetical protein
MIYDAKTKRWWPRLAKRKEVRVCPCCKRASVRNG